MTENDGLHSLFHGLECQKCGAIHPLGTSCCPKDGGLLLADYKLEKGHTSVQFRSDEVGVWRFSPLLPPLERHLSRGEGSTPMLPSRKWGRKLGLDLFFKDEGANPSGSFKDRGVAIMVSALDRTTQTVIMMSSGNASSSVALYSALAGVHPVVLMYQGGTRAKVLMTQAYGATVFAVHAEREGDVLHLAETIAQKKGWPLMNTTAMGNPLVVEGYKTLSYELAEELKEVDVVLVPMASGTLLCGIWKGFDEVHQLGMISRVPRLVGVQPTGSCPIVKAFEAGLKDVPRLPETPDTIAAALSLDDPGESGALTLRAIRETEGGFIAVEDKAILSACQSLALDETIFVEPAAAAGFAAIPEALKHGVIRKGERVVCVLTGHGLKDIDPVAQSLPAITTITAEESEFMTAYGMTNKTATNLQEKRY